MIFIAANPAPSLLPLPSGAPPTPRLDHRNNFFAAPPVTPCPHSAPPVLSPGAPSSTPTPELTVVGFPHSLPPSSEDYCPCFQGEELRLTKVKRRVPRSKPGFKLFAIPSLLRALQLPRLCSCRLSTRIILETDTPAWAWDTGSGAAATTRHGPGLGDHSAFPAFQGSVRTPVLWTSFRVKTFNFRPCAFLYISKVLSSRRSTA